MATKYNLAEEHKAPKKTPIAGSDKVFIREDGAIEAEGFIDMTREGLEYEELKGGGGFYFKRQLDDNTEVAYLPVKRDTKLYKSKVKKSLSIKNAFAVISRKVKKFVLERLDRFKHKSKRLKNEIRKVLKAKKTWNFTRERMGEQWNEVYIESNTFGPYNYDVKLKVTKDIDFINDLIVIKTGGFVDKLASNGLLTSAPDTETIAYISPHEIVQYEGAANYLTTGETVAISWSGATGVGYDESAFQIRDLGITNAEPSLAPSSKFVQIPSGEYLQWGHLYNYKDSEISDNLAAYDVNPVDSAVGNIYQEYNTKILDPIGGANWDGVIPSGAWFRVESWSTNPKYFGFDGEISVVPVDSSIECAYNKTVESEGIDKDYSLSLEKASSAAEKKLHKGLNVYLVDKGIKNKNNGMKKWENLQTKVAQNVYEGLDNVRNENVTKEVGTVKEPLDSLKYYDGTSKVFGGSKDASLMDYSQVTSLKSEDALVYGAAAIGVTPEQYAELLENEPTVVWDEDTQTWIDSA